MKQICISIFAVALSFFCFAQDELNGYKYVVVPNQYEFLKGKDKYKLSSLTKFLFNRKGFEAYVEDDALPQELFDDRCLALYADVVEAKGGLKQRRVKVLVRDCRNNLLYETRVGRSGENNHERAFQEALRDAFVSIDMLNYKFQPGEAASETLALNSAQEESKLKNTSDKEMIVAAGSISASEETSSSGTLPVAVVDKQMPIEKTSYSADALLSATKVNQEIHIVNLKEELVMILLPTSAQDVFMVKNKNAIVYKKNGKWVLSSYQKSLEEDQLLNIEF